MADVFLTGGTGFLGRALTSELVAAGHRVTALARRAMPAAVTAVTGNLLDAATYAHRVPPGCTYVHLAGVSKPAPWKAAEFAAIDRQGLQQALAAARRARAEHFIYVSVAHPAPVMQAYVRVRMECEALLREAGIPGTVLRPWYVLGPGRRWPLALVPLYKLGEWLGSTAARRLGLVTREEMVRAMLWAVEHPGWRIIDVPTIRLLARQPATASGKTSPCPDLAG